MDTKTIYKVLIMQNSFSLETVHVTVESQYQLQLQLPIHQHLNLETWQNSALIPHPLLHD
jgi:hypothetical protein